jgi:hypothetical protein
MPDLDDDSSLVIRRRVQADSRFEDGATGQDILDAAARRGRLKRTHRNVSRLDSC